MKTLQDPRHKKREKMIKKLYAMSFRDNPKPNQDIQPIWDNITKIDSLIGACAPEWPIAKLNKIDLAILRLAVFEITNDKKIPIKVVIDEAVELGKQYGSDKSSKFINGVLGTVLKKIT